MPTTYLLTKQIDVALLIEEGDDGVFLYTIRPGMIGDTWHATVDEAKAQAAYELGRICGPWHLVDADFGNRLKTGKTNP
ncbi:MAG TPA: hypothetical protein VJ476_08805 [Rhizomicrobium sp.]|nr:hypothetical protein [Rhizomicrobium sp.]